MAVPGGAAGHAGRERRMHRVDRKGHGVQADRAGGGGAEMGCAEEPARHELRQAEQVAALLLREGHHAESGR